MHPGPIIGTFNPTGLSGKGALLQTLPSPSLWGVCESHLTKPGIDKFRTELSHTAAHFKMVHGAPAPLQSQTVGSIGGKQTGVCFLSSWPCRALAQDWPDHLWDSARVQCCATLIDGIWVKLGLAYGYASNTYTRKTMAATDELLHLLTDRIVYKACGPRIIMGDFNHSKDSLDQFQVWRQNGWVEVQEYAWQKWQRPIQPTTRGGQVLDHMWISREMIPLLANVHVDDTWFATHSLLYAEFTGFPKPSDVPLWRKPLPIPWDEVPALPAAGDFQLRHHVENPFAEIFGELEKRVDAALLTEDKPGLLPQQKGRCTTVKPTLRSPYVTPVKPFRRSEVKVTYFGENFTHVLWCRQMRRLQSLALLTSSPKRDDAWKTHQTQLWLSIRRASGFTKGFCYYWQFQRSVHLPGVLPVLPMTCPTADQCQLIFATFRTEFAALEKALKQARLQFAKDRRVKDRNLVFRDVAKPRSLPAQTLVTSKAVCVQSLSEDRLQVTLPPDQLSCVEPVFGPSGLLPVVNHIPGCITLKHETSLEPGDPGSVGRRHLCRLPRV